MWPNMGHSRENFQGGGGTKWSGLSTTFSTLSPQSLSAARQNYPSGGSRSPAIRLPSLTRALLRKVVERLPAKIGGFAGLHHMTQAPVIVSQDIGDQLDHTDTCRDTSVPPVLL